MPVAPYTVLVAPDSFKSTLTAVAAATATIHGLRDAQPHWRLQALPLADGGEGTLDCVAGAISAERRRCPVTGIHGRRLRAPWLLLPDGTAIIESARVLGLPLLHPRGPALAHRGSGALGHMLRCALRAGARRIVIGLGGSACNDAGLGLLIALGARVRDGRGRPVTPDLAGLMTAADLDTSGLDRRLADTPLIVLCDVDNPLTGPRGTAAVYGPQKGLPAADIKDTDAAMRRFAALCGRPGLAELPGAGAAGGLGFALAWLGAELVPGADFLADLVGLRRRLSQADAVVTGEGRSDGQTLHGKLPAMVAATAKRLDKPAFLLAGSIDEAARPRLDRHFAACLAAADCAGDPGRAQRRPRHWLRRAARELAPTIAQRLG